MRIPVMLDSIPMEEALRFLGWRGQELDAQTQAQLEKATSLVLSGVAPAAVVERFSLGEKNRFSGTLFSPHGQSIGSLLNGCEEALLMAATLGSESERLLLRMQAISAADALVLDAVMSAAIEAVCDEVCRQMGVRLAREGLMLTRRFSPGYGDMPVMQTEEICAVLDSYRRIGLGVSSHGTMIPRKSVCAVIGITKEKPECRYDVCANCTLKASCLIKKTGARCRSLSEE